MGSSSLETSSTSLTPRAHPQPRCVAVLELAAAAHNKAEDVICCFALSLFLCSPCTPRTPRITQQLPEIENICSSAGNRAQNG